MEHRCDIYKVLIEKGAIKKIGDLTDNYSSIVIVADRNTYAVCGDSVTKQ